MFAQRRICSWIGAFGLAAGAFGQTYVQFSVGSNTSPWSINAKGEIAGFYGDSRGPLHGFVRDPGGTITTFNVPGSSSTQALSINEEGVVTGFFTDTLGLNHAYIRDPEGNFTTFDVPGSIGTGASSINAKGEIAGSYQDANNVTHGFLRQPGGEIDPPGSIDTVPRSINAEGEIAGIYQDANNVTHGFLRQPWGGIVSFDPPGSTATGVVGINYAGAITGSYFSPKGILGYVRDPKEISQRSTRVLAISRQASTTKERLQAGLERIPALCGRRRERIPCSYLRFAWPARPAPQASMTEE